MLSLAVAFVCLIPLGGTHPPRLPYFDKYIHVFLFASLTVAWVRGFSKQNTILFLQQNAKKSAAIFCFFDVVPREVAVLPIVGAVVVVIVEGR